ncbi:MAG: hypothetical protein FWG93_00845 [Oscillospiraceae bacterium]|nr:hypothetical protein [Oscillospiraceae bacterium]
MSNREPVMKHYRGRLPISAMLDPRPLYGYGGRWPDGRPEPSREPADPFSEEAAQAAFAAPETAEEREYPYPRPHLLLATGPLVWPETGFPFLRLENTGSECAAVDVRVYDLRRGARDILRIGSSVFRKTIKLAAFHTGTVSFDLALPGGLPVDVTLRAGGAVLPLLEVCPAGGVPRPLYRSCDFVPLNRF